MLTLPWLFWLLPFVFLIHDGEEIFTITPWLQKYRSHLRALAARNRLARQLVNSVDLTRAQFSAGVAFELLLSLAASGWAFLANRSGPALFVFLVLTGALFLHSFSHLAQPFLFEGYTPGLLTAGLVVLPACLYLYRRLWQAGLADLATLIWTALLGGVIVLPVILLAHRVGRWLIPATGRSEADGERCLS